MIPVGSLVSNRYRVISLIGKGAMKEVYLAEDQRLSNRRCALAEMTDSFSNPDMRQLAVDLFQREADILAALDHAHIVRVTDRFSEGNRQFLVMEYIAGETLERLGVEP